MGERYPAGRKVFKKIKSQFEYKYIFVDSMLVNCSLKCLKMGQIFCIFGGKFSNFNYISKLKYN